MGMAFSALVGAALFCCAAVPVWADGVELRMAIAKQNTGEIDRILTADPSLINVEDSGGETPLQFAIGRGDDKIVEFLISKGATVDIFTAAALGKKEVVERYLKVDPKLVGSRDKHANDETALHQAAWYGRKDVGELLLANGADVNARSSMGETPLHAAAAMNKVEFVSVLLAHKADINAMDEKGWTPLHAAAHSNRKETVELLLASGADATIRGKQGQSALDLIAGRPQCKAIETLLLAHTPVNDIFLATTLGRIDIVERLLKADPQLINTKNGFGYTPLALSASPPNVEMAKFLIAEHADVNVKGPRGVTPLYLAAGAGSKEIAALLLKNGADINVQDQVIGTPVWAAFQHNQKDMVKFLATQGADINVKGNTGMTMLGLATAAGMTDWIDLLHKLGAKTLR
jgi:uncharacterized protein